MVLSQVASAGSSAAVVTAAAAAAASPWYGGSNGGQASRRSVRRNPNADEFGFKVVCGNALPTTEQGFASLFSGLDSDSDSDSEGETTA